MPPEIHLVGPDEAHLLEEVAPDVFDHDLRAAWTREFLAAPRHHLAIARIGRTVVGALVDHARALGCTAAWVLTEEDNRAAQGLYRAIGGRRGRPDPILYEIDLKRGGE